MHLSSDGDAAESPEKKKKRLGTRWQAMARARSGSVSTKGELHEWCGVHVELDKWSVPR